MTSQIATWIVRTLARADAALTETRAAAALPLALASQNDDAAFEAQRSARVVKLLAQYDAFHGIGAES